MQHDGTLYIFPSGCHCTCIQRNPENNSLITIANMDQDQRNSIKINIHPKTQALLNQKCLALVQKQTQYYLKTRMNIFIIWTTIIKILTFLIHRNRTWKTKSLKRVNNMSIKMITLSLKKNLNMFTQTLTKHFHLQQLTQV